jgi:hypothetical protein
MRFHVQELSVIRGISQDTPQARDKIKKALIRRDEWRDKLRNKNYGGTWIWQAKYHQPITDATHENLVTLLGLLLSNRDKYKITLSGDWGYMYTSDTDLLNAVESCDFVTQISLRKCKVNRPKNSIRLRKSKHQYRSYLRNRTLTQQQRTFVSNWLKNQTQMRLGPALKAWIKDDSNIVQDYYFFDHNDMADLAMLNLVHPGLVRRTMTLISGK